MYRIGCSQWPSRAKELGQKLFKKFLNQRFKVFVRWPVIWDSFLILFHLCFYISTHSDLAFLFIFLTYNLVMVPLWSQLKSVSIGSCQWQAMERQECIYTANPSEWVVLWVSGFGPQKGLSWNLITVGVSRLNSKLCLVVWRPFMPCIIATLRAIWTEAQSDWGFQVPFAIMTVLWACEANPSCFCSQHTTRFMFSQWQRPLNGLIFFFKTTFIWALFQNRLAYISETIIQGCPHKDKDPRGFETPSEAMMNVLFRRHYYWIQNSAPKCILPTSVV